MVTPIVELLALSMGLVVYVILALHSLSAVSRLRDFGYLSKAISWVYFIVVIFGIPFVIVPL